MLTSLLDDSVIFHRYPDTLLVKSDFRYIYENGLFRPVAYISRDKRTIFTDLSTATIETSLKSETYKTKVFYYPTIGGKRDVEILRYNNPILRSGVSYPHSVKPKKTEYNLDTNLCHLALFSCIDVHILNIVKDYMLPCFLYTDFHPISDRKLKCNLVKAQKKVRNIIRSNWIEGVSRHTTLTYKKKDVDFAESKRQIDIFQKRLNRYWVKNFGERVKLIWVAERQHETRDTVHFHIVIFNHYYTSEQALALKNKTLTYNDYNKWFSRKFWREGYTVTTHVVRNKTYCAKYLSKSNDFNNEINKRIWSCSRGLKYTSPVYFPARMPDKWVMKYSPIYTHVSDVKTYNFCVQQRRC